MLGLLSSDRMCRAGHAGQGERRIDRDRQRQFTQRRCAQQFAAQTVGVTVTIGTHWQDLRIDNLDSFFGPRFNRKHTGLEDVAAVPFEQTRITFFTQYCFVDFASPLFFDDVRFNQIIANPHSKTTDRCVLW